MSDKIQIDRKKMIELLNEDLSREYQAVIAYVNYSQVIKGAQYMEIAKELEKHAKTFGAKFGIKGYTDLAEMLQRENIGSWKSKE